MKEKRHLVMWVEFIVLAGCTGISGCRGFSAYYGLQSAESIRTSGKCSQRDQQTSPDADWTICSE